MTATVPHLFVSSRLPYFCCTIHRKNSSSSSFVLARSVSGKAAQTDWPPCTVGVWWYFWNSSLGFGEFQMSFSPFRTGTWIRTPSPSLVLSECHMHCIPLCLPTLLHFQFSLINPALPPKQYWYDCVHHSCTQILSMDSAACHLQDLAIGPSKKSVLSILMVFHITVQMKTFHWRCKGLNLVPW